MYRYTAVWMYMMPIHSTIVKTELNTTEVLLWDMGLDVDAGFRGLVLWKRKLERYI